MSELRTIRIITEDIVEAESSVEGERGGWEDVGAGVQKTVDKLQGLLKQPREFPVEKLKSEMTHLYAVMTEVFEQLQPKSEEKPHSDALRLEEIELSVEIDSQCNVGIVGFGGAGVGGKGAITLTFKRPNSKG
jgi:hypothetical protein